MTGTRIVATGSRDEFTAAAVKDALCGSIAITTRSLMLFSNAPPQTNQVVNGQGEEGIPTLGNSDLSRATPAAVPDGTQAV